MWAGGSGPPEHHEPLLHTEAFGVEGMMAKRLDMTVQIKGGPPNYRLANAVFEEDGDRREIVEFGLALEYKGQFGTAHWSPVRVDSAERKGRTRGLFVLRGLLIEFRDVFLEGKTNPRMRIRNRRFKATYSTKTRKGSMLIY